MTVYQRHTPLHATFETFIVRESNVLANVQETQRGGGFRNRAAKNARSRSPIFLSFCAPKEEDDETAQCSR